VPADVGIRPGALCLGAVRYQDEADAGPGFFNLARELGLIHGSLSGLERLAFWLRHVRQVQAHDWSRE
jgi:hypothetical protein